MIWSSPVRLRRARVLVLPESSPSPSSPRRGGAGGDARGALAGLLLVAVGLAGVGLLVAVVVAVLGRRALAVRHRRRACGADGHRGADGAGRRPRRRRPGRCRIGRRRTGSRRRRRWSSAVRAGALVAGARLASSALAARLLGGLPGRLLLRRRIRHLEEHRGAVALDRRAGGSAAFLVVLLRVTFRAGFTSASPAGVSVGAGCAARGFGGLLRGLLGGGLRRGLLRGGLLGRRLLRGGLLRGRLLGRCRLSGGRLRSGGRLVLGHVLLLDPPAWAPGGHRCGTEIRRATSSLGGGDTLRGASLSLVRHLPRSPAAGRSLSPIGRAASRAGINEIQCAALPGGPGVRRERRRIDMSSITRSIAQPPPRQATSRTQRVAELSGGGVERALREPGQQRYADHLEAGHRGQPAQHVVGTDRRFEVSQHQVQLAALRRPETPSGRAPPPGCRSRAAPSWSSAAPAPRRRPGRSRPPPPPRRPAPGG